LYLFRYCHLAISKKIKYIKVSILNATHREPEAPADRVQEGIATIEAQVASSSAAYRTGPIEAVAALIAERTINDVAEAGRRQF